MAEFESQPTQTARDKAKQLLLEKSPFTSDIMMAKVPPKFRMPPMKAYDGSGDPIEHVETFNLFMDMYGYKDAIKCRTFCLTLTGLARSWYRRLITESTSSNELAILSFKELAEDFVVAFYNRLPPKVLTTIKQRDDESLEDYIRRFTDKLLQVEEELSDARTCTYFKDGLRDTKLKDSIDKNETNFRAVLRSVRKKEAEMELQRAIEELRCAAKASS